MKSQKSPVALFGYHGQLNTGDDALACSIAHGLWKRFGYKDYLMVAEPESIPMLPPPTKAETKYPWMTRTGYCGEWLQRLICDDCGIFLFAGGAMFHEGNDYNCLVELVKRARSHGAIVGGIGISLGPFKSMRQYKSCGEFLKQLDFLTIRGSISYDLALSFDLPYEPCRTLDLAITLRDLYDRDVRDAYKCTDDSIDIGLSVCDHYMNTSQDMEPDTVRRQRIVEGLKKYAHDRRVRVTLFEFNGHPIYGDGHACSVLKDVLDRYMEVEIQYYSPDPSVMWRKVADMDTMVAMRYHAGIFAYALDLPFVMLDYHPKCTGLAIDVGLARELVLDAHDLDPSELAESLQLAVSRDCPMPRVSPRQASELAERNFSPLEQILRPEWLLATHC